MKEKLNRKNKWTVGVGLDRPAKGITLIALIITIIIMLILVAVSINVLIQSNIIGAAKKAGQDYKTESEKEATIGKDIKVGNHDMDKYIKYYYDEPHEADTSLYFRIDDETHTLYISGHPKDDYLERKLEGTTDHTWRGDTSITTVIIEEDIYPSTCASLFEQNTALEEIQGIQKLHTGNATSMAGMFANCNALISVDTSTFDTSNVIKRNSVFAFCGNLKTVYTSNWDTSNVTAMKQMFDGCKSLTTLNTSNWDTSNVTDMSKMFAKCGALTTLDTSKWDTAKVINMSKMFLNCPKLEEIDVSSFDVRKVENFLEMFAYGESSQYKPGVSKLEKIKGIENWQTDSATNMAAMFAGDSDLKELNLKNFKTNNVTSLKQMFVDCTNLEKIYVGNDWTIKGGCDTSSMFYKCNNLIGGAGTVYDGNYIDATYARIDDPENSQPGYFTQKQ